MDVIAAYRDVAICRGAAVICSKTHKTVKRIVEQHEAHSSNRGGAGEPRAERTDEPPMSTNPKGRGA
jgi:hypothetical protein